MSVLDFLFPVIMAADSRNKVNQSKRKLQEIERSKSLGNRTKIIESYIINNYTDNILENTIEPITTEELLKTFRSLPSYDPERTWNISYHNGYSFQIVDFKKRFALAKHGKIMEKDIKIWDCFKIFAYQKPLTGGYQPEANYTGQMYHEMFVEWENELKRNGFPYDLYVYNQTKCNDAPRLLGDASKLARCEKYEHGNEYFWSFAFDVYNEL